MRTRFTERLRLEPIGPEHADDLFELFNDDDIAKWYGGKWTRERAKQGAETFARGWTTQGVSKWIAYDKQTGELIGRGGLSRITLEGEERLELGWAVRSVHQRQGYATEIGRAGLVFAFDELDADEVFAFTETRNTRSRAVMQRLGMTYLRDIDDGDGVPAALYVMRRVDFDQADSP